MQSSGYNAYGYNPRDRRGDNYSDPSRPSYRPEWWRASVCHWDKTRDWTGFLEDPWFKNCYLCNVPGELEPDRNARIEADSPEPFFKDAVKDHASIFSSFELAEDAPQSLIDNQNNVDGSGGDLWQWTYDVLFAFFRDGGALIGADIAPAETEEQQRQERTPRLLWVPLSDVYWPEYRNVNGVSKLSKISVRRGRTKLNPECGLKAVNDYWVYELNEAQQCTLTVWTEEDDKFIEGDARFVNGADGQPLDRLPFTDKLSLVKTLDVSADRPLMSPFADILLLNIEHYNQRSEYNTVKRKTALPKVNHYWADGVPDPPPPFYAGSGKVGNYSGEDREEYLELKGESLPELRQAVYDLEGKIAKRDNKLFSTVGNRSATEADIENQKAKAGYPGIKRLIESAFQDLFTIWEAFANPAPEGGIGGITISDAAIKSPPNPQELASLLLSVERSGMPIEAVMRKAVRDGHFERDDFNQTPFEAVLSGEALAITAVPLDESEVIQ